MKQYSSEFTKALKIDKHPMRKERLKIKVKYYVVLEYLTNQLLEGNEYTNARLEQYRNILINDAKLQEMTDKKNVNITSFMINCKRKYRYCLLCDIALITNDITKIHKAATYIRDHLSKRQTKYFNVLVSALYNDYELPKTILFTKYLVEQFRSNRVFAERPEARFIVTANVSAGKSTLINAIIGKSLSRTSQEICTGNLCYIYSKPYEDSFIHLSASPLNLNANYDDLVNADRSVVSSIASHFRLNAPTNRICIIDTPGVNSSINRHHRKIAQNALKEEVYDKVIYVLNANKIGTDEEKEHLQWVSGNVSKEKVVFVLNKLDDFKSKDDSIKESIEGIKRDLIDIGYVNPLICPLSAYFAFLVKLKANGELMTEDEIDAYNLYVKKFTKETYNLSIYYKDIEEQINDSELVKMSKRSGLYGLEYILFGGNN